MRKVEYWIKPWGEICETIQNPCGCHPYDVMKTNENQKSFSYSFKTRREFVLFMKSWKWELLK